MPCGGGSMGSVVGEKVARAAELATERRLPLLIVAALGVLVFVLIAIIPEFERALKLDEGVICYLISVHEHELGAPPMTEEQLAARRKADDDDDDEE